MGSGFDFGFHRADGFKNGWAWGRNQAAVTVPFLALMGVIGFVMGLIAVIKYKDRALLTLLSIPVGIIILAWTIAEIAFPH